MMIKFKKGDLVEVVAPASNMFIGKLAIILEQTSYRGPSGPEYVAFVQGYPVTLYFLEKHLVKAD